MRSLISLANLTQDELAALVTAACACSAASAPAILDRRVIGLYFAQPSTRTRTSFSSAALRLGAGIITYGPNDLQLSTGETEADTGDVLATMLDALVVRASGDHAQLWRLSGSGALPIVNAMNTVEHPTQAIGDLATMRSHRGDLAGIDVLYVGEANSTTRALAHALMRVPSARLTVAAPSGYGFELATLAQLATEGAAVNAVCTQVSTMDAVAGTPDFVYTTQWQTTGTNKVDPCWRDAFHPEFQVNRSMIMRWPKAKVMHDLPARRGDEITAEALDGPRSIAREQAGNKLASAAATLTWVLAGPEGLRRLTG